MEMASVNTLTVGTKSSSTRNRPVFIGGAGRSGTTLLRVMLASHPNLCGGPEFKLIPQIADLYRTMKLLPDVMGFYNVDTRFASGHFGAFLTGFFEHFRAEHGDKRLVEKTPHNVLFMSELAEILPHAKFLHIVRDGRDVACSLAKMDWKSPDGSLLWYVQNRTNAFRYWAEVVTSGLRQATLPHMVGRVCLVRYEDLIIKTEPVLRGILEFLEEPWSPEVMSYNKQDRRSEPIESSTDQVAKDLYQSSRARWHTEATPNEVESFKQLGGNLLVQLGYEKDIAW